MLRQHLKETETDSIPPPSGRARRIIRAAALETRLARCRGGKAKIGVVPRAPLLAQEPRLHTPVTLNRRPRLVERLGIFHPDADFDHVAAVDQLPAFDDVKLLGMGRAVVVDVGLVVKPDSVDHECVVLVIADGFAVPRWLRIGRMRYVKIDAANLLVTRMDHQDFLGSLYEEDRFYDEHHESRNACRHAARSRRVADSAGEHLLVLPPHDL